MDIAVLIVLIVLALAVGALTVAVIKNGKNKQSSASATDFTPLETLMKGESESTRQSILIANKATSEALQSGMKSTNDQVIENVRELTANNNARLMKMEERLERGLADVRADTAAQLDKIRGTVDEKLDRIRGTVDEKLTKTLDERFTASFKTVSERLEAVNRGLVQIESLSTGVDDLRKVLGGVKQRGNWGEVSLETLLEDMLVATQYERQCNIVGKNAVDFAIILPGDDKRVLLPVDSKFPVEDYLRILEALDPTEHAACQKALAGRIRQEARSIRDKYIKVPLTTDFAVMYLPSESLYAEVLRIPGLAEEIQNEHRVIPAGPTNFVALLNSLRMGFKTLQIQKYSQEMVAILRTFRKDFINFMDDLVRAKNQITTVQKTIDSVTKRSGTIQEKLVKVDKLGLDGEGAPTLIGENEYVPLTSDESTDEGDAD